MTNQVQTTEAALVSRSQVESLHLDVNDVQLHVVAAGEEDGPLVVLLHGFPEFWYAWRDYLARFVDAGYRVLVPDQRGYNLSEKPPAVADYRISTLSRDVAELIATTGHDSAHVVGHDWGAAVAWDLALRHPETVDHLGILNVPHPTVFRETLTSSPRQLLKSWYMFFFQLPRIPEWNLRRNDFQALADSFADARGDAITTQDVRRYRAAWRQDGAVTGMMNWYRALFRHAEEPPREEVTQPTAIIWGEADDYLRPELAPRSLEYCADGRLERFSAATHWIHHERPDQVSDILLDHLDG